MWILFWSTFGTNAGPLPGWTEAGPERGHVIDVAVGRSSILAVTRAGVLSADVGAKRWHRDARFPTAVKHLAAEPGTDATWATSRFGVWRVTDQAALVGTQPEGAVVDLESPSKGVVLLAVRGQEKGVWRLTEDGTRTRVLDQDPWQLDANGKDVWVGTLGGGLWFSKDGGEHFSLAEGEGASVSAISVIDGQPWVGWSDGRVTRKGAVECTLDGHALSLAGVAGRVLAVMDSAVGPASDLYACGDGAVERVQIPRMDDDPTSVQPTALWSLNEGQALLGTFRGGPMLVDRSGMKAARTGFRGILGAAGAVGPNGRLAVAWMATGVFASDDSASTWSPIAGPGQPGPVTDSTNLMFAGERLFVVDFEGIAIGLGPKWYRTAGVHAETGGRNNGLVEVTDDADGRLWARDFEGKLYQQDGATWTKCATAGVLRLDGRGDHMLLVTDRGLFRPGTCAGEPIPAWPAVTGGRTGGAWDAEAAHSDGHWLAGPGQLWFDGSPVAELPNQAVLALGVAGERVVVAFAGGEVTTCEKGNCAPATKPLPGPVVSIGFFTDGRIWAVEEKGSLLVSGGAGDVTAFSDRTAKEPKSSTQGGSNGGPAGGAESRLGAARRDEMLRIPPWRELGRPDFKPAGQIAGTSNLNGGPLPSENLSQRTAQEKAAGVGAASAGAAPVVAKGPLGLPPLSNTWFWGTIEVAVIGGLFTAVILQARGKGRGRRRR